MSNRKVIGVDIGGSHITSAIVDLDELRIIFGSTFSVKVDNKASKDHILKDWSKAVNNSIKCLGIQDEIGIGFAMPGPFNYKKGIGMFVGNNEKYESLNGVSIPEEMAKYLNAGKMDYRFLNDATAFGVGVSSMGRAKNCSKVVAITLGTGFGSAFIKDGIPQVKEGNVPQGGFMWDKPFRNGLGDDYFSTRWCIKRYKEFTGVETSGVKEIVEANNFSSKRVFEEFGSDMAEFMVPFLHKFEPDLIVFGGNISKASELFIPSFKSKIHKAGLPIDLEMSDVLEEAAIIGSAKLFDSHFWSQVHKSN